LHPSGTELGGGVSSKSANIGTDERNTEKIEIENFGNGEIKIVPSGGVITSPMLNIGTRTKCCGSRNDEG